MRGATIKVSHLRSASFIICPIVTCYLLTERRDLLIFGMPDYTFIGVVIVPVGISLLLLIWALRW